MGPSAVESAELVRDFANTIDIEDDTDSLRAPSGLTQWLRDHELLDRGSADRSALDLARRLRDEIGCGVLLVEHDMRVIFGVCERIQVLDYGKSIAAGVPAEIAKNPAVVKAYLGEKGASIAQAE